MTSDLRVLSTEKHCPVRRQHTVYTTRVYSARWKYIVRHWTSREILLRHSSGWGTLSDSPQYHDLLTRGLDLTKINLSANHKAGRTLRNKNVLPWSKNVSARSKNSKFLAKRSLIESVLAEKKTSWNSRDSNYISLWNLLYIEDVDSRVHIFTATALEGGRMVTG